MLFYRYVALVFSKRYLTSVATVVERFYRLSISMQIISCVVSHMIYLCTWFCIELNVIKCVEKEYTIIMTHSQHTNAQIVIITYS